MKSQQTSEHVGMMISSQEVVNVCSHVTVVEFPQGKFISIIDELNYFLTQVGVFKYLTETWSN